MVVIDWIVDKYLTWRTGKDQKQRTWETWYAANVNLRAGYINSMFENFKHIIVVDCEKFFDLSEPFGWVPQEDVEQYCYPNRELGDCIVWKFERVIWDQWDQSWHISTLGDEDMVFVATNNDADAMMIALRYS
jgi:hypothetical protein